MTATGTEARVCQDIAQRQAKGIARYGTTVEGNPLGLLAWYKHHYEEILDAAVYVKRIIEVMEGIEKPVDPIENFVKVSSEAMRAFGAEFDGIRRAAQSTTLEDGSVLTETAGSGYTVSQEWLDKGIIPIFMSGGGNATNATATGGSSGPAGPHHELRKTWKPGQRWQVRNPRDTSWYDLTLEPSWRVHHEYRRHPEDRDPPATEKPWVPDDSGEWVEIDGTKGLPAWANPDVRCAALFKDERQRKCVPLGLNWTMTLAEWFSGAGSAKYDIVAYKVVK